MRHGRTSWFLVPVVALAGTLALLATGAVATVPSSEVPDGLKTAIRVEVESKGHVYAGLCSDVPDDGSGIGKYCGVVLALDADTAQVSYAPYATDGEWTSVTFVLSNGTWQPGQAPTPGSATATPGPTREWVVEGVGVDGSTVRVRVRVYAGIDVGVQLDGRDPDQVVTTLPVIEFIFVNVSVGSHQVKVRDVVGFEEVRTVSVTSEVPPALVAAIKAEVERRGHGFAGICRDVPDDGTAFGKYCANVFNLTTTSADVAFGPYATNELTTVKMELKNGAWSLAAPAAPNTGTGPGTRPAESNGTAIALLATVALVGGTLALALGRRSRRL